MSFLKQATSQAVRFGPFVDDGDFKTSEISLTIAQADMQLSKDGAAFAQKNAVGNATHDTDGWYSTTLDATDTATVGELILQVAGVTGALPVWVRWYVLEEAIYDALYAASAAGFDASGRVDVGSWLGTAAATPTIAGVPEVDLTHIGGDAQSATDLKDFADAGYDPGSNKVNGVVLVDTTTTNSDMVAEAPAASANADAVWDEARGDHVAAGSFGQVGELIVANGVVETDASNSALQVQTDLAEASNDHYDVMTILFTSGAEAGQSRLITSYVGATGIVSWNAALTGTPADDVTFVILSAGTTADAVWDEILTGTSHNIATSAGKRLRELAEAFVQASGTVAVVTDGHTVTLDAGAVATADYYPHSRLTIVEGTGAGQSRLIINYTAGRVVTLESNFAVNPDTMSLYQIEAADANVPRTVEHLASGYVAVFTNLTTITLDSLADANADLYVDCMIIFPDGAGAGQARRMSAYTAGRVVTLSPALDTAVAAGTSYRITAIGSANEIADLVLDEALSGHTTAGSLGKAIADIDTLTAALNDLSVGDVDSSISDALTVDTIAELSQGAPETNPTLVAALMRLYMALTHLLDVDSGFKEFTNNAGTVIWKKALADDGSNYTEAEGETGP